MNRSPGRRVWLLGCGSAATLIIVVLFFALYQGCKTAWSVYTVPMSTRQITITPREALGPGTLPVAFENAEGDLVPGWYKQGENGATVLLLHGLGATRAQLAGTGRMLRDEGYGVLMIDQRGHGEHTRDLTTFGRAESVDALAAVQWLRNRPEVDGDRIGIYGASMGATTCIYAAAKDPDLACAVADSSYASLERQAYHDLNMPRSPVKVPKWLHSLTVRFFMFCSQFIIGKWAGYPCPEDVVGDIKCPVFLIHGELDSRIDAESLDVLSRAAREGGVDVTEWLVRGEEHCKYRDSPEFRRRLLAFFAEHLTSRTEALRSRF